MVRDHNIATNVKSKKCDKLKEVGLSNTFRLGTREDFKVSKLFCVGDNSILNIFSTNSFTVNQSYCGLYVKTSRINHACDPNACYNNNGSLEKQVRAVREIAAGEEITISYISGNSVGFLNFDMDILGEPSI